MTDVWFQAGEVDGEVGARRGDPGRYQPEVMRHRQCIGSTYQLDG